MNIALYTFQYPSKNLQKTKDVLKLHDVQKLDLHKLDFRRIQECGVDVSECSTKRIVSHVPTHIGTNI